MPFSLLISHFIGGSVGSATLLSITIIVGSFFLEDITAVIVGVLAADAVISIPLALLSLFVGVLLSDIALYSLGWLASAHPRLGQYVDHDLIAPFRSWIENSYGLKIFSATFIPGSRFPTYTASGFFRSPFSTFILSAICAVIIWITFLFCISYSFGAFTSEWLGPVRWSIACVFALILLSIGVHNFNTYRAKKK